MAFSPQSFLSNIAVKGGPAKPSRFEAFIPLPNYLATVLGDIISASTHLSLTCESAEIPGKNLQTQDVKIYGPTFKVPYQTAYTDLSLTFVSSNSFYERKIFDRWINLIMPLETNNLRFPKDSATNYLTNIQVTQFDDFTTPTHVVQCIDSFPIGIASQPLNWGDQGFHRVTVLFAYQKYKVLV